MGDDRPSVYREGDDWIIRASALGGCMRSLIAAGRDVEPSATPEWMQKKFDQGHAGEAEIRAWYWNNHKLLVPPPLPAETTLYQEDGQIGFDFRIAPNIIIRGHLDDAGAEYKLLAPSTYAKATAPNGIHTISSYPWQLSVYMMAMGMSTWDWVCVEKDDEGKPNLERTHVETFTAPPFTWHDIESRVIEIVRWIENEDYDAYPACDLPLQYPCPYFLLHDEEEIPKLMGKEVPQMSLNLKVLEHIKLEIKAQEERKAAVYDDIKRILDGRPTVMCDGTRVTWVHTETPEHMSNPKPKLIKAKVVDYPKITPPKKAKED